MKTWKGRTEDGTFAVELQASVLGALDRYCRDSGSVETGGILIGCYSADLALAIVREATPPPTDSKRGRSWFVRGVSGLSEMLDKRWRARERTFYIGEWHFHPANHVEPSGDDFAQMIEISRAREYDCKEPLLLILGASKHEGQRIFRAFVCPAEDAPLELRRDSEEIPAANAATTGSERGDNWSDQMTDHTSEDDESDIIIAGRQVPFVQVGMIVHPDDCLSCERDGNPLWCSALVCDIHDDDEAAKFGMMATLIFRNGERRDEPCDELRRRWRVARDFDQNRVYTGRWGATPRGSVWPVAEVDEEA